MAHERHDVAFVVGALLGGVAGAACTLFNAPQSGSQTRAQLAEQFGALTGQLGATVAKLGEQGEQLGQRATATVSTLTERVGGGASTTAADPATERITEPIILLPDPLESDPVVLAEPVPADTVAPSGAATVGGLPAGDDLDHVIDGPRPAGADR